MLSILSRRISLEEASSFTSYQQEIQQTISGFAAGLSDWKSLVAATAGGFAYRLGKVGILELGAWGPMPLFVRIAPVFGLTCEVSAFRGTHVLLQGRSPASFLPAIFNRQWFKTALDFVAFKGMGRLAEGQNIVLRNFAQSLGMVFGNEVGVAAGWLPSERGSFVQKLARAQVLNMQMSAGMALGSLLTQGRLQVEERSLALRAEAIEGSFSNFSTKAPLPFIFAMANAAKAPALERPTQALSIRMLAQAVKDPAEAGSSEINPGGEFHALVQALFAQSTPPLLLKERLEAASRLRGLANRRRAFMKALLQRETQPSPHATGFAAFVDFPTLKAEADRVASADTVMREAWAKAALQEIQADILLADANFGRREPYLRVLDHHGVYAQEKNSTEQLLDLFEGALKQARGNVAAAIRLLNIREISSDNLGDGGWCVWIAQHQRQVLENPSLRDTIRRATHFEDFTAFGNNYERNDPAVQLQAAVFKRYGDNLKSKGILGSDRFPPAQAKVVVGDAMQDISLLLSDSALLKKTANEFWAEVDAAKEVAARSILLEEFVGGRRVLAFYDMAPLRSFSIFAQWLAVPDLQRELAPAEKLLLQATVASMPPVEGPHGASTRSLPIIAIPDGRELPSQKGLLSVLQKMSDAELLRVEQLKREGKLPAEFKGNFWFGKDSVILPSPLGGGTVLSLREIADILMGPDLALFVSRPSS